MKDYYHEQKAENARFSLKSLGDRAGFKSKTFLYKVMTGEKSLAPKSIIPVAMALGLRGRELRFFESLVNFNESKTLKEREFHFKHMAMLGSAKPAVQLKKSQVDYFTSWYNAVIRELVTIGDFKENYTLLGRAVIPQITSSQAQTAVKLLLKLGMIKRLASGRYKQTDVSITTGDEFSKYAVHKFQRDTMKLAVRSLDAFPKKSRSVTTLTVGLSKKGFERLTEEVATFRRIIMGIVEEDNPAEQVYQMNFQIFPVSKPVQSVLTNKRPSR